MGRTDAQRHKLSPGVRPSVCASRRCSKGRRRQWACARPPPIDEAERMSLTVVVTNYLRSANVTRLIDAIRAQTLQATIFVWDNSPAQDFDDPRVDWLIRSSRNAQCTARWWMASHAETDFVLVHDDDLMPSNPNVLAWTVDAAAHHAPFAVGASGVVLNRDLGYWHSRHVGVRAGRPFGATCMSTSSKACTSAARRPSLQRGRISGSGWRGRHRSIREARRRPAASASGARQAAIEFRAAVRRRRAKSPGRAIAPHANSRCSDSSVGHESPLDEHALSLARCL